jgi:uncharacterized protein GlcG (DUF336 family)
MAHLLPIDVVDSILTRAITTADYQDAAQLALVNKWAASVYKQNVDVAQGMMTEIARTQARTSAFFKVCIKAVAKGRVVSILEIRPKSAVISELSGGWRAVRFADSENFASALQRMVTTPHLRDVRVTVTFRSLDQNTMLPAVMRFVKFMNAKCSRSK